MLHIRNLIRDVFISIASKFGFQISHVILPLPTEEIIEDIQFTISVSNTGLKS